MISLRRKAVKAEARTGIGHGLQDIALGGRCDGEGVQRVLSLSCPKRLSAWPAVQSRASLAGSAVDLMKASFFRSLEAVNGALFARRPWRSKTIDSLETSEVHAFMRPTARRVAEEAGAPCRRENPEASDGSRNRAIRILFRNGGRTIDDEAREA